MKTTQGFLLIDVDVAALNNAGIDQTSSVENVVVTKKIMKNRKTYPYVSGQAWRYWWRETLKQVFGWEMSPVTKVESKNQAFTAADPIKYRDDDIFGYMRADKEIKVDEKGEPILDKKGNPQKVDCTLTRVSPLKNSALIAVAPDPVATNQAFLARHQGNPVLYKIEEYSATMKGMFSLSIDQVGVFSDKERTGFKNINEKMKKEAIKNGAQELNDPFEKDIKGNPLKLIRIEETERLKRIKETILALKTLAGGSKLTTNLADVTPKLIVLATLKSGNHPFSHLAKEELGKAVFSVEALKQVVKDYQNQIEDKIYVGRRTGFMDELEGDFKQLDGNQYFYGSVNEAIDKYADSIKLDD